MKISSFVAIIPPNLFNDNFTDKIVQESMPPQESNAANSGGSAELVPFSFSGDRAALPPMLQQYLQYKQQYPDCIILFQVGDFYEVFFDDAVSVARTINLTLTSRDKNNPHPIPMCGVPIAAVDSHLERLVDAGFSCALVSQTMSGSDPAAKNGVPRKLTRMVTPGVRVLGGAAAARRESLCAAVALGASREEAAIALTDVQSGRVQVSEEVQLAGLVAELQMVAPNELLLPNAVDGVPLDRRTSWVRRLEQALPGTVLKFRSGPLVQGALKGTARPGAGGAVRNLPGTAGFSALTNLGKRAVWGLLDYVDETTAGGHCSIAAIERQVASGYMRIDAAARQSLELVRNSRDGGVSGTLFQFLNSTVSELGERALRQWILAPLVQAAEVNTRLEAVRALVEAPSSRESVRAVLKNCADLERIVVRLELGAASPRELGALRDGLRRGLLFSGSLESSESDESLPKEIFENGLCRKSQLLQRLRSELPDLREAYALLEQSLADSLPLSLSDGGVIRGGYDAELDRVRALKQGSADWMAEFERTERQRTGIASLKVRDNNVLGFFIEITRANVHKIPADYQRRQSTAQAERFTTDALRAQERDFSGAEERERAIERAIFERLRQETLRWASEVRALARILGALDVLASLAEIAEREALICPSVDESLELEITQGKHPVVASLVSSGFVANDLTLLEKRRRALVITGPNMGGKSTYLRQSALITIMAQLGSFVPAAAARIGIVDQVFARIGASDNLAEGESTFMVEMREVAHIVRSATNRSLILIDEVGRGTATADGLALAQAILEWIVTETHARTLFATHFHELTGLALLHPLIANVSVTSVEQGEDVVFTHHLSEGAASKSYGIAVAKLAGLPGSIIERARELMAEHAQQEGGGRSAGRAGAAQQIPLFRAPSPGVEEQRIKAAKVAERLKAIENRVRELDLDRTTPIDALQFLHQLRSDLSGEAKK